MVPAAATVAGPDLSIERSVRALTLVTTESELFVGSLSAVVVTTDALLVSVVAWLGAVTTMVNVVLEPEFQVALVQVTEMLALLLHVQPPLDAFTETNVTPGGSVSVTLTLLAFDGPLFATASW